MTQPLPDKPSDLIDLALDDLVSCQQNPSEYVIHMGYWHTPNKGINKCLVCLAGSVIAMTLGFAADRELSPKLFNSHTRTRLNALNDFRVGDVGNGFSCMGLDGRKGIEFNRDLAPYGQSEALFIHDMRQLAADLRMAGY